MRRVGKLAGSAAAWLGLNSGEVRVTRCAALLHDLGKVLIPPSILNNPGKLSEGEWAIVRRHPEIGAKLLSEISGYESSRGDHYPSRASGRRRLSCGLARHGSSHRGSSDCGQGVAFNKRR
jgi:hypothetical protein